MPGRPTAGAVSLVYGSDSSAHSVTITQRPGRASELGLIRVLLPAPNTAREITVRGQPAVVVEAESELAANGGFPGIVQWIEPPGLLVTVWVEGLADDELGRLIERLRTSTDAEIDELVDTYHEPPGTDDGLQLGEIVVAEGDRGPNHWRVTAREDDGYDEVSYEDDNTGFGFGSEPGPGSRPADDAGAAGEHLRDVRQTGREGHDRVRRRGDHPGRRRGCWSTAVAS
jgi:hypothetical protein